MPFLKCFNPVCCILLEKPNVDRTLSLWNCCFIFMSEIFTCKSADFQLNYELNVSKYLFFILTYFFIHLLPILANEFIKYQRGCDTWQVTAKIAQPCIFLTKSHECTVNCAISSLNFSNYDIICNSTNPNNWLGFVTLIILWLGTCKEREAFTPPNSQNSKRH